MKQPDRYYFEAIKMTSQAWSKFTENTRLWLVPSIQNLTRLMTSFLNIIVLKSLLFIVLTSRNAIPKKLYLTLTLYFEGVTPIILRILGFPVSQDMHNSFDALLICFQVLSKLFSKLDFAQNWYSIEFL